MEHCSPPLDFVVAPTSELESIQNEVDMTDLHSAPDEVAASHLVVRHNIALGEQLRALSTENAELLKRLQDVGDQVREKEDTIRKCKALLVQHETANDKASPPVDVILHQVPAEASNARSHSVFRVALPRPVRGAADVRTFSPLPSNQQVQQHYTLTVKQQAIFDMLKDRFSLKPSGSISPLSLPIKISLVDAIQPNFELPFLPKSVHDSFHSVIEKCLKPHQCNIKWKWESNLVPDDFFKGQRGYSGSIRCLASRSFPFNKSAIANGTEFACKVCCNKENKGYFCMAVLKHEDSIITLLPAYRKTLNPTLTPNDEAYWFKEEEEADELTR